MKILLRGGHVIDPANGVDEIQDIAIDQGTFTDPNGFNAEQTIDASGHLVLPGIVDICARLREPGQEHKATIASETAAAAAAGITRLVCPPDTYPVVDTPAMATMIRDRAEAAGKAQVHPLGALTVGLQGEKLTDMAMLQDAGCVGVSNGLAAVENTLVMRRAMQYASTYDVPVFLTPQDTWLLGNGVVHEGEISTRLGLPAIPEAAETVGVARDLALIETSGARAHINQLSCGRSVAMIREALDSKLPVTASVAIHQLLLNETHIGAFDTRYKVFPPLRTAADQQQLVEGVRDGTIGVICSDHQPHGRDTKLAPFVEAAAGIAGIDTLLSLSLGLAEQHDIPLSTIVAALTTNPARIIGVNAGHLGKGASADLCMVRMEDEFEIQLSTFLSQGTNSPFAGHRIKAKVMLTLNRGRVVFQRH